MSNCRQIRYYARSPAALLVEALGEEYTLCALPEASSSILASVETAPSSGYDGDSAQAAENSGAPVVWLADLQHDDLVALRSQLPQQPETRLVGILPDAETADELPPDARAGTHVFACLPRNASRALVGKTLEAAFANIALAQRERAAREELERTQREMEELNRIGVALSATRDVHALFDLILAQSREITGADAGSLYLVEEARPDGAASGSVERRLRFKLTQNDSLQFPFTEFTLPVTEGSMAGYVALHGEALNVADAYALLPATHSAGCPYRFNPQYDLETGYCTRSVLTLPMRNGKGEVLGVLQLINCKRRRAARLDSVEAVAREVQAFPERAVRLALSLASQAAVAYENNRLYQDIETLFEGFVQAAVTAIEQRDPTTSGHSQRVSTMTVGLAEIVDRVETGAYADVHFTREQMKEIRYAALLHDFGKVGVSEEVLVKSKKLYPAQLVVVQSRFDYVRKEIEADAERQKREALLDFGRQEALAQIAVIEQEYRRRLAELDEYLQVILHVNEPTVLPAGKFDRLIEIAQQTYRDPRGAEHPLLSPEEVRFLSIPKGSLDANERQQIESHVVHSFNFLMQIPWTKEIKGIPTIARAHHEKLNGSGYPYKLKGEEIPPQAKVMTVCDIFDALSAADRPYKKAVSPERALEILAMSVRDNELDPVLFQLFVDAKIYQLTLKRS